MNVSGSYEDVAAYKIRLIVPPILMTVGIPGNILSIIVLYRLRKAQPSTYLLCLAVSDLILLSVWVPLDWIGSAIRINSVDKNGIFCRVLAFGYFSGIQISSWMLILVTIERVCSVLYPHKVRTVFSPCRSLISVSLTVICIAGVNAKFLAGILNITPESYCFESDNFDYFYGQVWPWIYLNIGFIIPCISLLLGNIIIVVTLWRKKKVSLTATHQHTTIQIERSKVSVITKRVIVLNSAYIAFGLPVCVYVVINFFGLVDSELIKTAVTMVMFINNNINFFLYIMVGSRFRQEVLSMFSLYCRCGTKRNPEEQPSVANTRF